MTIRNYFKFCIASLALFTLTSCYKDQGNYDIDMPIEPEVVGLDTLYQAIVGDSLIIAPEFTGVDVNDLEFKWELLAPEATSPDQYTYYGTSLRTIFGLRAQRYGARLTVTNKNNGMKYFHTFNVQGITEFTSGSLVLSVENGITQLSFVKPDSTVQARIYEAIHQKSLPSDPLAVYYLRNQRGADMPLGYWIITKSGGVRLNVSTLREEELRPGTLAENFFLPPAEISVGNLKRLPEGVLTGVINGKYYYGTTSTWDQANTYGMFGGHADGDYELANPFVINSANYQYSMIAFEKNRKQFVRFNIFGSAMYFGTQYAVINPEIFDPMQVNMDLIHMVQINESDTYAYCKDASGTVHELKFNVNFGGPFTFTPAHKKAFSRQELFTDNTKILATRIGNIYIAAGNKVYRYTPLNDRIVELETSFSSPITMLTLSDNENTLMVGTPGQVHYLAVQVGRNGDRTGVIDGIPGSPIDMTWR